MSNRHLVFFETKFKCRCLFFLYQRQSITHEMNGTWKSMSHMSLTSLTRPRGLHREWYQVIDVTDDIFCKSNCKLVKERKSNDFRDRWY